MAARRAARQRRLWVGLWVSLLAACAAPRAPPLSAALDEHALRRHLSSLTSDDFEGRRPGTAGGDRTVDYLVAQFRSLGLKPAVGDSYLQQVPLVEIIAGADTAVTVVGRGGPPQALEYGRDMVIWSPREVSETALSHSALVFVGYGIIAPEYGWNDYAHADVRGKTVVVLANDPGVGSSDPQLFRGNVATSYARATYKIEEAARQGAVGVLLIHNPGAGDSWSVVVHEGTGPRFEAATADGNAARARIEGWLSGAAARALFVRAGVNFDASAAAAARPGFAPIDLGLAVDAVVHSALRRLTSANVIGVLPGAERAREYVIYSAHWDHLGRRQGALFSGAVDDASGVAGLLTLAQSFSRTRPALGRSFVFIAFTGGEAGLLGSSFYVDHPVLPLRQTAGVLNLEQLHVGGPSRDVAVIGDGNSELEEYLREAALLQGREVHADFDPQLGRYYRSDEFSFARSGVPAIDAGSGLDDAAHGPAWGRREADVYRAERHHEPADRYSPEWDLRGALEDLRLYYEIGGHLGRSRRFPRWYPGSEFLTSRGRSGDLGAQ